MLIVKCLRKFSQMLENETIVSMKSRFLRLSSFSDSNSFMTAGPAGLVA